MTKSSLSLEENIATLRRSCLPTVVTEGSDDYLFFRRIEEELAEFGVSFFPVGGREMVINIFKRRKELGRNNVIFVADLDLWVFSQVPDLLKHRKLVFTEGYSIENDLFRDGELERLLYNSEMDRYKHELRSLVEWYSFCVRKILDGNEASISENPGQVLDTSGQFCSIYATRIGYTERAEDIYRMVLLQYERLLRGKTLISLLVRHLSSTGRPVKYGRKQLLEIACSHRGLHYTRICGRIKAFFTENSVSKDRGLSA